MARQDPITVSGSIADAADLIIDGSGAGTGAVDVFELGGTGACDVVREIDSNGDGTFDVAVTIQSPSGAFHSQKNALSVSQSQNTRLRVTNTSGASNEYYAAGYEVPDGA
jgi:hypothetical protein